MPLIFPGSSASYALVESVPVSAPPFTLAARFWSDAPAHEGPLLGLFNSGSGNDWFTIGLNAGKVELTARSAAAGIRRIAAASAYPTSTWRSAVGVFAAANDRRLYNGADAAMVDTTSVTPLGLNRTGMGRFLDSTPSAALNAIGALFVVWQAELTPDEAKFFAVGAHPYEIRPGAIVACWDALSAAPERDLTSAQRTLSLVNLSATASAPLVDDLPMQTIGRAQAINTGQIEFAALADGLRTATSLPAIRGKAVLIDWRIDAAAKSLQVRANNGPWQSRPYLGALDDVQGDVYLGTALTDGVPDAAGQDLHLASIAAWSRAITDLERDTVDAELARRLAPVLPAVQITASTSTATTIDLLANALDPSGEGLRLVSVAQPVGASVNITDAAAGKVTVTPNGLRGGATVSFAFAVTNKFFKPATSTGICLLTGAEDAPPTIQDVAVVADADVVKEISPLTGASSPDGKPLLILSATAPANGTVEIVGTTKLRYTPTSGYVGDDSFVITVATDTGPTATATISIKVKAAAAGMAVFKPYRVIGFAGYGGSQGEVHDKNGEWWRFRAATIGTLDAFLWYSQGARGAGEYNDGHTGGTFGEYIFDFYAFTGSTIPVDTIGASKDRSKIGGTQRSFYPGRPSGPGAFDAYASSPTQALGDGGIKDGVAIQAYNIGLNKGIKGSTAWNSTTKYFGTGWYVAPIGKTVDGTWSQGVELALGDDSLPPVLLVNMDNRDAAPTTNFSMDNTLYMAGGPNPRPDLGLKVPYDEAMASFFSGGSRAWRQLPHFGVRIDGKWYGQPAVLSIDGNPGYNRADAVLITDTTWVRQVITLDADFDEETVASICAWAWKHTGPNGSSVAGNLEVSAWRAPFVTSGTPAFVNQSGWKAIPGSAFKAYNNHPHGEAKALGSGKLTSLSDIYRHGFADIADLKIVPAYHYAIAARSSNKAVFGTSAPISGAQRFNNKTTGLSERLDAEGVWPRLPAWGDASNGRHFNKPQISTDSGATWKTLGGHAELVLPFCLIPKN